MYLDILGTLSVRVRKEASGTYSTPLRGTIKYPPFPLAANPAGVAGVSTGEQR